LENASNVGFGFADVHVEEFGAFDGEEIEGAGGGDCFGEEGFSCAWGSVE